MIHVHLVLPDNTIDATAPREPKSGAIISTLPIIVSICKFYFKMEA